MHELQRLLTESALFRAAPSSTRVFTGVASESSAKNLHPDAQLANAEHPLS